MRCDAILRALRDALRSRVRESSAPACVNKHLDSAGQNLIALVRSASWPTMTIYPVMGHGDRANLHDQIRRLKCLLTTGRSSQAERVKPLRLVLKDFPGRKQSVECRREARINGHLHDRLHDLLFGTSDV
jgi:hypothetical protein